MIAQASGAAWSLDPWLLLALTGAALVYGRGFVALRRERPDRFGTGRAASYFMGLFTVLVAVASPLDAWADLRLQAHMVQHWLLVMVAPPLLWLGLPAVPLMRGLPVGWLRAGVGPVLDRTPVRGLLQTLTRPDFATALLIGIVIAWHLPAAYELALGSSAWHDVEHASFFWAALCFWHPVIAPWPSRRARPPIPVLAQLFVFMLFNGVFSAVFAFSTSVFYPSYAGAPRLGGLSALADQNAAGAFMWVAGSLPMAAAAAVLLVAWLSDPDGRRARSAPTFDPQSAARRSSRAGGIRGAGLIQRGARAVLFGLAAVVVVDGLLGTQQPSALNLAGVLPWTYWRPVVVLGLVVSGNLFCAACPFVASRDLAGRLLGRPFRWPRRLRGRWVAAGMFAVYLLGYELFALWDSPWWTAWVIVGYFGAAFVVEGLFARGTFCRHVCPIGQLQFVGSLVSPRSVQSLDDRVCADCTSHDCLRGNTRQPGCPTGLFVPNKASGLDCTLCLDCARACPHDNVAWRRVQRTVGLGVGRTRRSLPGADTTAMIGLFVFGAFVNAAAMVAPAERLREEMMTGVGPHLSGPVWALALIAALIVVPFLLVATAARIGRGGDLESAEWRHTAARFLPALVPLGVAMWLAHFSVHLLAGPGSVMPAAQRALASLGAAEPGAPSNAATVVAAMGTGATPIAWSPELWMLAIGLFASGLVVWRLARETGGTTAAAARIAVPWAILAMLLHLFGAWILRQPMAMRGMLM